MNETMRQLWGEMLRDYPGISGWFLEGVKSGMVAGCALLMGCLLARRSALSRSWVIRMGFLALGIATVWNFVPESEKTSQPRIFVEVSAPLPSISLPSVPFAEIPVPRIPDVKVDYRGDLVKSPDGTAESGLSTGLHVEESPFSLQLWIEENLKLIWFGMASFIAIWLTVRYLAGVFWLRKNGRPVGGQIRQLVEEITASLRVRRTVKCQLVEGLGSPLITGWRQANIWLPNHVVEMPPAHQRVIIEHELAHFRRNDFPWQSYASLIAAFWWWNPLVFLLLRKLKSEAELAADEMVVCGTSSSTDYAEALIKVATGASYVSHRETGVPMLGRSSIEKRVKEIISENPFRNRIGWIASIMIGLVAVGGGLLASFTAVAQQREQAEAQAAVEDIEVMPIDDVGEFIPDGKLGEISLMVVDVQGKAVSGTVVRGFNTGRGEPVQPFKPDFIIRTGKDGRWKGELPLGRFMVLAKNGSLVSTSDSNQGWWNISEGKSKEDLKLILSEGGRVRVSVIDGTNQKSVAGARVILDTGHTAVTDDTGGATIHAVPRGERRVKVVHPPHANRQQVFNTREVSSASVEVSLVPGFEVVGRVLDASGAPVKGAKVGDNYSGSTFLCAMQKCVTDAEGRYQLGWYDRERGLWSFSVEHKDFAEQSKGGLKPPVGSNVASWDFTLDKGWEITGMVSDEEGRPVKGATVRYGSSWSMVGVKWAKTDANGRFHIVKIGGESTWPVVAEAQGYAPGQDKAKPGKGAGVPEISFRLKPGLVTKGRVVDTEGNPVKNVAISPRMVIDGNMEYVGGRIGVDDKGEFEIRNLPTSGVSLDMYGTGISAIRDMPFDPTKPLLLTAEKPGVMIGKVLDAETRKPVEKFSVSLGFPKAKDVEGAPDASFSGTPQAVQSSEGKFLLEDLINRAGHEVTVKAEGYPEKVLDYVEARPSDDKGWPVEILLQRGIAKDDRKQTPNRDGAKVIAQKESGEDANTLVCVVAAEDGTLVEGADVYFELLQMPNGETAVPLKFVGKTDASGETKIQVDRKIGSPENLKYSIFVRHPVFGTAARGGIDLSWTDPRTLLLSKGFPLKFRVLDGKGDPVRNLGLRVARAKLPDGEIELMKFWGDVPELPDGFWHATTDSDGRCVIHGLPAGRFYVDHGNPDFAQFPGSLHHKFQHVAGADFDEIELKAEPAATVTGTVKYPDGKPVEGAGVKVLEHYHYTQGGCSDKTTTDSEGRYLLKRLLPGDYDIRVTVGGKIRDSWTADLKPIELALGDQKQDFDFELEEGGVVTGRVMLEDTGTPVPGYNVGAITKNGPSPLHLWWAVTDEDGYYSLRIPAGKRRVYPSGLNPEGYTTQKSDQSEIGMDVDVKEGGTYNNDFAILRETGIRGIVVNAAGNPVAGAQVTCYDPPDRMSHPMNTESDEEGRFSFIFPAGTKDAGIFAEFEGKISKPGVNFPVASEAKVVVGETQWARVRGRVVDVSDQPIEGARVSWSSRLRIEKQSYEAMTDTEGYFESKMLPENYLITFWGTKNGFGSSVSQASFKENETVELEPIKLFPANASLRGTLVTVEGKPIAGARISASGYQQPNDLEVTTDEAGRFAIDGMVDGWVNVKVRKSQNILQLRLRTGADEKAIVFKANNPALGQRKPINHVGKPAPPLIGKIWYHTDPLDAESKGKVRLISFVGIDRPLIFHDNTIKALEKFRKEIPVEELEIILVHGNWPREEVDEILKNQFPDLKLPLVIEPEVGSMSEKFGVNSWLTVVIDQTGKVVFQDASNWGEAKKQVRLLLENPKQ